MQKLDKALDLKPKQRESIRKIIGNGQSRICKVIQDPRQKIPKVLTPGQQKGFDKLLKHQTPRTVLNPNDTEKPPPASKDKDKDKDTNEPEL